jgi:hypothetical protein
VKEPNVPDNDLQVRTLFTDAAGNVPPGIDLLHGFRARQAARRVRGRLVLATAAGSLLAAATAVTLTITTAPSALAQLTSAVSRTAGLSYDITATVAAIPLRADGPERAQSGRVSGEFDPVQRTGEETFGGFGGRHGQIRFIGPYVYLYTPARPGGPALPGGKSWVRAPSPQLWEPVTAGQGLSLSAGLSSLAVTSPQNLFALLRSASMVDRQGSASGDGWTGTSYAFTARITFGPDGSSQPAVTAAGTVAVDQQGRVRRLDVAYTQPAQASLPPVRVTAEMAFSDFGTSVSVSPPPASEVFIPANIRIQPARLRKTVALSGLSRGR